MKKTNKGMAIIFAAGLALSQTPVTRVFAEETINNTEPEEISVQTEAPAAVEAPAEVPAVPDITAPVTDSVTTEAIAAAPATAEAPAAIETPAPVEAVATVAAVETPAEAEITEAPAEAPLIVTEAPEAPVQPEIEGMEDDQANTLIDEYNESVDVYNEQAEAYNEYVEEHNAEEEVKVQESLEEVAVYEESLAEWEHRRYDKAEIAAEHEAMIQEQEEILGDIGRLTPETLESIGTFDDEGNLVIDLSQLPRTENYKTVIVDKGEEESELNYDVLNLHVFLKFNSAMDAIFNGEYYNDYSFDQGQVLDYTTDPENPDKQFVTLPRSMISDLALLEYEYVEANKNDTVTITNQGELFQTKYSSKDRTTGEVTWKSTEGTLMTGRYIEGHTAGDYWVNDSMALYNAKQYDEEGNMISYNPDSGTKSIFSYKDQNEDYLSWIGRKAMTIYNQYVYSWFVWDSNPKPAEVKAYEADMLNKADTLNKMDHVKTVKPEVTVQPADNTPAAPAQPAAETPVYTEEPAVIETVTAPVTYYTPAAPAAPETVTVVTVPEAEEEIQAPEIAEVITEEIEEAAAPMAAPEVTTIEDAAAPKFFGSWALVNLILTVIAVLTALLTGIFYLFDKEDDKDDEEENEENERKLNRKGFARVLTVAAGIISLIVFLITEDLRMPMVITDKWTLLMALILVAELICTLLSRKEYEDAEEDAEVRIS